MDIEQNKKLILEIWKKAKDYNELETNRLKAEYGTESVEFDEDYQTWKFKSNNVEFTFGWSDDFCDYELTGDALKFATEITRVNEKTYEIVDEEMTKNDFHETDSDIFYRTYEKYEDGKEYQVDNYAEKMEDIEVRDS